MGAVAPRVLVVNAGSSSLRLRLLHGDDEVGADAHLERSGDDAGAIASFVDALDHLPDAVGHRVVHGGASLPEAIRVDEAVEAQIDALTPLAPLHQPPALAGIRRLRSLLPGVPSVACFDTAFHRTLPPAASTYALPAVWRQRWDLRRFGFHGLSHSYASRRAIELLAGRGTRPAGRAPRVVTCHLGAGASLCATLGGVSVDTTMGFTPLEGLVMATRSGSVDPGLVLWLVMHGGLEAAEVEQALRQESGLAGLAGSGDLREVLRRRRSGDPAAVLAYDVYVHRLTSAIGAMTATLGGLDALVFTGGVGEHEPEVRSEVVARLAFLGVALDEDAGGGVETADDSDITADGATAAVFVVAAREDLEIARLVRSVLISGG